MTFFFPPFCHPGVRVPRSLGEGGRPGSRQERTTPPQQSTPSQTPSSRPLKPNPTQNLPHLLLTFHLQLRQFQHIRDPCLQKPPSLHLPHRVSGEALLVIDQIEWSRGRITDCECQCSVSRGRVGQRLLDACVSALGCRPGPAFRSLARDEVRSFDDVSALLRINSAGIELHAAPERSGSLARTQGLSILEEPQLAVPLDRLAWLLAPPGAVVVPASRTTAWLLGFFTIDAPGGQALRPLRRSEF